MTISPNDTLEAARALHRRALVMDSHCDTTQRLVEPDWDFAERHDIWHVDLPRLREGGVGALILAVYAGQTPDASAAVALARTQLDCIHQTVRRHGDSLALARSADDVLRARRDGRIAVLIGIEGGHLIADSIEVLREFHERGAVYMTLTHAFHTTWADSSGVHEALAPLHGGLTEFGREVVREMNRLGMMVDVSHSSDETFWDVLRTSTAPPIASHS
jgi:membrane dipeptidase